MPHHRWRRRLASGAFVGFCAACVLAALIPLGLTLFFLLRQGLPALNYAFFTQTPKPVGEAGGGMANPIPGTLVPIGTAARFPRPPGVLAPVFLSGNRRN